MGRDTLSDEQTLIWAAGFLDGEGHFSSHRHSPEIAVAQVNPRPLMRLKALFGVGKIASQGAPKGRERQAWRWRVYGPEARGVALKVLPFLVAKPGEAEAVAYGLLYPKGTALGDSLRHRAMEERHMEYTHG